MDKVIICKYSEIHLKGNNRHFFEKILLNNIKYAVKDIENVKVQMASSRYIVYNINENNEDSVKSKLLTVFGIHSLCVADMIDTTVDNIFNYFNKKSFSQKTFKVYTTRADKTFPIKSMELSREIGGIVLKNNKNISVDVHNPELEILIDIRENNKTYISTENIKGLGGMPVGSGGNGLVMLSGGIDSPVCAYQMAKRGMNIAGIHFHSFPFTSEQAKEKVITLAHKIRPYTHLKKLIVVPFTKIQQAIHEYCNEEYMITIMRRFMMRISERVADEFRCQCIITGESLGQVASQTVESITVTNNATKLLPVLRPLIAMDKEEIIEIARKIDTYNTSILPYEDCCTVFLPKNPIIKPKLNKVEIEESKLDIESLVKEAVENIEIINIQ